MPGVPLHQLLDQVSKLSGKKLIAAEELYKEPIVLAVQNVPLKDLMDKLADEFVAEWKTTDQGIQLTRTPEAVDAFQKNIDDARSKGFEKSIDELRPIAASQLMDDKEAKQIAAVYVKLLEDEKNGTVGDGNNIRFNLEKRTGDRRLLAQLALLVGSQKLAGLAYGSHVFSLDPTPMEEPIEGFDTQLLNSYIQQKNLLAKAIQDRLPKDTWDNNADSSMFTSQKEVNGPVKPLLQIFSDPKTEGATLILSVYDSTGQFVGGASQSLGNAWDARTYMPQRAKVTYQSKNEENVTMSPVEQELIDRYSNRAKPVKPLSEAARYLLSNAQDDELLGNFFATILIEEARRENRNLIASVGDGEWRIPRIVGNGVKPSVYELSTTAFKRAVYDRPEGWLVVKAANPIAASSSRIPREALDAFVRAWFDKGFFSIEDWAELATHLKAKEEPTLTFTYWNLLAGQSGMTYDNDWDSLRLYGYLSQNQIDQLSAGKALEFYTLSQEEQQVLQRLVYETGTLRQASPSKMSSFVSDSDNGSPYAQGVDGNPQESVPNGIPNTALLTAKINTKDMIYIREGSDTSAYEREIDINELAWVLVRNDDPKFQNEPYKFQSLRLGTKRSITFDLSLNDKVKMESELREDQYAKGDPILVDQLKDRLPPEMWEKLQAQMKTAREQAKKWDGVVLPNDSPPPPPLSR